jgi:hypothetical protein
LTVKPIFSRPGSRLTASANGALGGGVQLASPIS